MLTLMQGSHNTKTFNAQHPDLEQPAGAGFFASNDVMDLQPYVDTTWKMRKKLVFASMGGAGGVVLVGQAREVLEQASSDSNVAVQVRWGIHQQVPVPGGVGNMQHFTVKGRPNDWHLYIATDGSRLAFMSNGPAPANFVKITKP